MRRENELSLRKLVALGPSPSKDAQEAPNAMGFQALLEFVDES